MSGKKLPPRLCKVKACATKHYAHGYCQKHYARWKTYGDVRPRKYYFATVHGMSDTRLFRIFWGVRQRCTNPDRCEYPRYGARGIRVHWASFQDFARDMQASYEAHVAIHGEYNTTLDRIDFNGDYRLSNCRWATRLQQATNTTRTIIITINGQQHSLRALCQFYRLPYSNMRWRIRTREMSFEQAARVSISWELLRLKRRLLQ